MKSKFNLILSLLFIVSCGKGGNTPSLEKSTLSNSNISSKISSENKVNKTITVKIGVPVQIWVDELNKYFMNNPIVGINVIVEYNPSSAESITADKDSMPDIVYISDENIYKNIDSFADIGDELENKLLKNSVPKFVDKFRKNGKARFVPMSYNGYVFGYNKSMLKELGIDVSSINENGLPTSVDTFEEIFAISKKWYEEGYGIYDGKEITTMVSLPIYSYDLGYAVASSGGWKIFSNNNDSTDAGFETPEFKAGLEFIAAAADAKVKVEKVEDSYVLADGKTMHSNQYSDLMINRTSPMALVPTSLILERCDAIKANDDILFAPMPTWNGNQPTPFTYTEGFVINGFIRELGAARVVLEKLYSEEVMQLLFNLTTDLPVLNNNAEFKLEMSPIYQSMVKGLQYGYPRVDKTMPFRTDIDVFPAYMYIYPEGFYIEVWNQASNYTGENRNKWLDELIAEINRLYFRSVAELNAPK